MSSEKNITPDDCDQILAGRFRALVAGEKLYLRRDIGLWKTSRLLNTNTHSLSRAINRVLEKTFSDFLAELRVEESLKIMQADVQCAASSRLTVEEIARRSGFNDRKSFFRTFKRIAGISPTEYRKTQKQ